MFTTISRLSDRDSTKLESFSETISTRMSSPESERRSRRPTRRSRETSSSTMRDSTCGLSPWTTTSSRKSTPRDKSEEVEAELKDMFEDVGEELEDIGEDLKAFGQVMDDPKYKAELEKIGAGIHKTDMKIKRELKFDDEGLKMWKLHMDNDKTKEIHADRMKTKRQVKKFFKNHQEAHKALHETMEEVGEELTDIGQRLEETGKFLSKPRFQKRLNQIGEKIEATNQKANRHLKFDDEGLDMWTLRMDNDKHKEIAAEREQQGKMMEKPKYRKELRQIGKGIRKTNRKIKNNLEYDDE